jgi:hypothetical protein
MAIGLIAAVGWASEPFLWTGWVQFILENGGHAPNGTALFMFRALFSVLLVVFAARRNWSFLVPLAVALASPVLLGTIPWVILLAVPRLLMDDAKAMSDLTVSLPRPAGHSRRRPLTVPTAR